MEKIINTDEFMNAKDIQNLGFSRAISYKILNDKHLQTVQIGKRKYIRKSKFFEWIERKENAEI